MHGVGSLPLCSHAAVSTPHRTHTVGLDSMNSCSMMLSLITPGHTLRLTSILSPWLGYVYGLVAIGMGLFWWDWGGVGGHGPGCEAGREVKEFKEVAGSGVARHPSLLAYSRPNFGQIRPHQNFSKSDSG